MGTLKTKTKKKPSPAIEAAKAIRKIRKNCTLGRKITLKQLIQKGRKPPADQIKTANINVSEEDLSAIVEEAVQWARNH